MKIELAGLPMILFIVFVILKLCKVITWSWWWVTSPLWIMGLIIVAAMVLYIVVFIIVELCKNRKTKVWKRTL